MLADEADMQRCKFGCCMTSSVKKYLPAVDVVQYSPAKNVEYTFICFQNPRAAGPNIEYRQTTEASTIRRGSRESIGKCSDSCAPSPI